LLNFQNSVSVPLAAKKLDIKYFNSGFPDGFSKFHEVPTKLKKIFKIPGSFKNFWPNSGRFLQFQEIWEPCFNYLLLISPP
jgi:hypothetical protein